MQIISSICTTEIFITMIYFCMTWAIKNEKKWKLCFFLKISQVVLRKSLLYLFSFLNTFRFHGCFLFCFIGWLFPTLLSILRNAWEGWTGNPGTSSCFCAPQTEPVLGEQQRGAQQAGWLPWGWYTPSTPLSTSSMSPFCCRAPAPCRPSAPDHASH